MELAQAARLACLKNAIEHDGTCQPKGLMGRIMGGHPEFRDDPGAVMKALMAAGAEVNAMSLDEQRTALESDAPELLEEKKRDRNTGLKPLPEANKPVLRFAPNPNGPLSLGHARGVAVMAEYARMHDAEVVLRFDDTDPKIKPPLYNDEVDGYAWIAEDYEWLAGRAADRVVKASDRIPIYYEHAEKLIEAGGAYMCTCDAEAWRDMKNQGHPCPHRSLKPEDSLSAFREMVAGEFEQGAAVLRVKTDIQHKDPALRDWTAFRIVDAIHPREKKGEIPHYTAWPLLDFESAVEDHLQGVTHIIRGKDLMDSTRKQQFLYQHMGWDYPHTLYWGRVKLHGFGRFSTSWMRQQIEAGEFTGWDDVRLPTLRALRRRGFQPDALRAFWVGLGLSEKDIAVSMQNIEAENGKEIDIRAKRFFFVPEPRAISLSGAEQMVAKPLVHPSHPEMGVRELLAGTTVQVPEAEIASQIRLKDLGNIVVAGGTAFFTGVEMDRSMPILQWLPNGVGVPFTVLRSGDEPEGVPSLVADIGLVEPAALKEDIVQFERYGFVRIESDKVGVFLHS